LAPSLHVLAVHGLVQSHRPARAHAPAGAERLGLSDRGAAGRPLRRGGHHPGAGRAAREGAPVDQQAAACRALSFDRSSAAATPASRAAFTAKPTRSGQSGVSPASFSLYHQMGQRTTPAIITTTLISTRA